MTSATARQWAISCVVARVLQRGEAEQAGVVAEVAQRASASRDGLLGLAARRRAMRTSGCVARASARSISSAASCEHGLEQADLRVADRELRRVHADRQPAGAGGDVVADSARWRRSSSLRCAFSASGMRGDHDAALQ